jgi:hypothetical protein
MTTALIVLALISLLLLILLFWVLQVQEISKRRVAFEHAQERVLWLEKITEQNHDQIEERRALADRIQHPERIQVAPVEVEPWEPPKDLAELAMVGQIVPDGVQVGTPSGG